MATIKETKGGIVMKVKELQIGDYVNYRGQIIKVTSLYDKGGSNEVGWSNKESVWVNAANVEPIPLTPEILKKNGFVVESRDCHGEPLQYCELVDGLWIDITGENYFEGKLEYIHQLQQALRLCGIPREIII